MKKAIKNNLFLFGYVKKYAFDYIPLIFIGAFFQALSSVVGILGIKYVVDTAEHKRLLCGVIVISVYFLINLLVKGFFQWTNYYFPLLARKVSVGMTLERMSASQKLDFECYDIPDYYDAYARALRSGEEQVSILVGASIATISNIATLISLSTIIASYSWWFLLVAIVNTVISYIVIAKQNKLTYNYDHDNTRINREENYYKNVCFSSDVQMEDRLFNIVELMREKYNTVAKKIYGKQRTYLKKYNRVGFFQVSTSLLLIAISMVVSIILINQDQLTLGEFVSSIDGVQSLSAQLLSLVIQFPKLMQNARYANDYKKIADYTPLIETDDNCNERDISDASMSYTIEFKDVSFKYPASENWVLHHLSFVINSNKKVAIVGENGAGKTTIIKLILRLYDPTEGEVLLNGVNIKKLPIRSLRNCYTAIFQDFKLYNISLQENVSFNRCCSTERLLKRVGLYSKFGCNSAFRKNVTRLFDEDGIVLSRGEAQRLCIARALSKDAPIILLDEPSASLDPITESQIIDILLRESVNKTLIVITHKLSMCTLVDEILYLENGCIVENGSHSELIKNNGKYSSLFTAQARNYSRWDDER